MESRQAIEALSALAQEHRLAIFRLLVIAGPDGMGAGDIAEQIGLAKPTLSFHLKELRAANLIDGRRNGRAINYALREKGVSDLFEFLMADCCRGRAELCGDATHSASSSCCD